MEEIHTGISFFFQSFGTDARLEIWEFGNSYSVL